MVKHDIILLILLLCPWQLMAQQLDHLADEKPVSVSSAVNFTSVMYGAKGLPNRRDPFSWFASGNIALSLYGWSVPFSFSYSNRQTSFQQPFNQYGITPQYKWIKAYVGYNSMNFSRYTLANHTFMGGGVELTPGKFNVSILYGRFNKPVAEDSTEGRYVAPVYKRMGYGLKAGYAAEAGSLQVVVFGARDQLHAIPPVSQEAGVLPAENLVFSIVGKKTISKRISLQAEMATSAFTRDLRTTQQGESQHLIFKKLFTHRASSSYYNAVNTNLTYHGNAYSVQLGYERIDPGYQTLGAYYFNNDLENITIGGTLQLHQNAVSLSGNVGLQRNNLDNTEVTALKRKVYALTMSIVPNSQWNINTTYSNFTAVTNVRPQFDPFFHDALDTLDFYQINQTATANIAYRFGKTQNQQSISWTASYQVSEETSGQTQPASDTHFLNGNLGYRYQLTPWDVTLTAAANLTRSSIAQTKNNAFGPTMSIRKPWLNKKLNVSITATYNNVNTNDVLTNRVFNLRLNGSYSQANHTVSLNANRLKNYPVSADDNRYTEITCTLNYGYTFR